MSATLAGPTFAVPREFMGLARSWRRRLGDVHHDDAAKRLTSIVAAVRRPLTKGSLPRPELLQEAARAWRDDVPTAGRLKLEIEHSNRRLIIAELRMAPAHQALKSWIGQEDAIVVFVVGFRLVRWSFEYFEYTISSVSLHALARRFERGADNSEEAIRSDLVALAAADPALARDGRFVVPVADGAWAGYLQHTKEESFLAARTFVP